MLSAFELIITIINLSLIHIYQATAASRAGAEVVMVTKIGRDFLARFAHEHYRAEEMTERYVYQANDVDTGAAFILSLIHI